MDPSDLLKDMSYRRLSHAQGKDCHCCTVAPFSQLSNAIRTKKNKKVAENLDLLQMSFAPHTIALVLMADAYEGTQSRPFYQTDI